jgi:nucleoside-diphosphate-sugar epimerase
MPKKVFIAGATGFTGQALVQRLLGQSEPCEVVAHVRPQSLQRVRLPASPRLTLAVADLADTQSIAAALAGCQVLVQLIGTTVRQVRT